MQEGKVCIADGPVETRDNLHGFKTEYNQTHPNDRIRTLADAIDKLIEIATIEVPELKEHLFQREVKIDNLLGKIEFMKPFMEGCAERDKRIKELEDEIKKLKGE